MPCFAYSAAICRVRLTIAPLAAQYAAMVGMPTSPATEPTLTIAPRLAAIISGSTARDARKVPVTFTAQMRCQLSGVLLCTLPKSAMPALLNRPSMPPSAWRAALTACSTLAGSVTSQATPNALPPSLASARADACAAAPSRSSSATTAPSRTSARAVDKPMPAAPPVMMTLRPASCPAMLASL